MIKEHYLLVSSVAIECFTKGLMSIGALMALQNTSLKTIEVIIFFLQVAVIVTLVAVRLSKTNEMRKS